MDVLYFRAHVSQTQRKKHILTKKALFEEKNSMMLKKAQKRTCAFKKALSTRPVSALTLD